LDNNYEPETWMFRTGNVAEVVITEDKVQAEKLKEKGWIVFFPPENTPGTRTLWIMCRLKGNPGAEAFSDKFRDLYDLVNAFMCDYSIKLDEQGQLMEELYRNWINFKARIERKRIPKSAKAGKYLIKLFP